MQEASSAPGRRPTGAPPSATPSVPSAATAPSAAANPVPPTAPRSAPSTAPASAPPAAPLAASPTAPPSASPTGQPRNGPGTAPPSPAPPTPAPADQPTLRRNDTGPEVVELQYRLAQLDRWDYPQRGRYDLHLQTAVQQFQETHGVRDDPAGVYGPATRKVLEATTTDR
ncbi:peptidoglycan-binding domain-containing protein [Streptomyces sp. BE20]|uniref:peptidoglycan-binding domain-containing protein n=1 Tax=Streptomyces sp. BE20 TaxID=3002525 RepID=UPI003FA75BC9